MPKDKESINLIYENDLRELFTRLNILREFEEENLKCNFCDEVLNYENFHSIFPREGRIEYSCNKLDCIEGLNQLHII